MNNNILITIFIVLGCFVSTNAMPQAADYSFNYQGELIDNGSPADGEYDIYFQMVDSLGNNASGFIHYEDVNVVDGLFNIDVLINNISGFNGSEDYFFEIGIRPGASIGAFTTMSTVQALQAVPLATNLTNGDATTGQVLTFNGSQWSPATPTAVPDFTGWDTIEADDFSGDFNDLSNKPDIASGLKHITENGNSGWRLYNAIPSSYGDIGNNAVDFSISGFASSLFGATGIYSVAMGFSTKSSGNYSTAMGKQTSALGGASTSMGEFTIASGTHSTAMGKSTSATSDSSTAMGTSTVSSGENSTTMGFTTSASSENTMAIGSNTSASGINSTAMGYFTRAQSYASTAIGSYNIGGGNSINYSATNPLFQIGNGNSSARSNALTVYGGTEATLNDNSGYLMIGNDYSSNIIIDNNEIMARNNGAISDLLLQRENEGLVVIGAPTGDNGSGGLFVHGQISLDGPVIHSSDRRLKKDIETLDYGLAEVLKLKPKSYHWKNQKQEHRSIGLIAQDVQKVMTEMVSVKGNEQKTLGVSYTEIIPVLINAIQEQQIIIEGQNKLIKNILEKIK